MRRTNTLIIGGGQAGLAMSRCLVDRGIDHVVLERGRVAESWRSERWDSLRLLTPNWQSRLPGFCYQGPDPDGYMTMPEVIHYLESYRRSFGAPVEERTTVTSVERLGDGYRIATDRGKWTAKNVVIATGECSTPYVPDLGRWPGDVHQVVPNRYRNPSQLPEGAVVVVGASATGIQLADEIHRSGRQVYLSVGRHTRLPRRYRGRDILWWIDRMGLFEEKAEDVFDLEISRQQPSLQLVGRPDHGTLDLPLLQHLGVRLLGRAVAIEGETVSFEDDLVAHTAAADVKLAQLLSRIDDFVARSGLAGGAEEAEPFVPFLWPEPAPTRLDLRAAGVRAVLWATGYRPSYPWLRVPVADGRGEIRHRGGITPAPGLYVLGLRFLRRRKSNFIDGVGDDARELAEHISSRARSAPRIRSGSGPRLDPRSRGGRTPVETERIQNRSRSGARR
jgi:putative flavoprotein involved in K+ transport